MTIETVHICFKELPFKYEKKYYKKFMTIKHSDDGYNGPYYNLINVNGFVVKRKDVSLLMDLIFKVIAKDGYVEIIARNESIRKYDTTNVDELRYKYEKEIKRDINYYTNISYHL